MRIWGVGLGALLIRGREGGREKREEGGVGGEEGRQRGRREREEERIGRGKGCGRERGRGGGVDG